MSEHDISDRSVKPNVIVRHDRQSTASSYVSDLEQDEPESASPISSTSPHGNENNSRQSDGRRRTNHLRRLLSERKARVQYFNKVLRRKDDGIDSQQNLTEVGSVVSESFATGEKPRHVRGASDASASVVVQLTKQQKEDVKKTSEALKTVQKKMEEYDAYVGVDFPIEIRMENLTYSVPVTLGGNKIRTVYNSSAIYRIVKFFKGLRQGYANEEQKGTKVILDDMSIVLRPGKMYLVLGPPGSGKSTFLRAIAGRLKVGKDATMAGSISYNGKRREEKTKFHIDNAIAFIDQLDRHAPRLSVDETFEFAYQCKRGGTHINFKHVTDTEDARQQKKRADEERLLVNTNLESLGISHVRDTFVGDDEIRGVSGGQRRRVTVGEMLMDSSPILCGDEISNGLDASSTFDMIQILMHVGRMQKMMRVISLLQPSPETVSLFDEVILLAQGNLLYVGPIYEVEDYFANLGYKAPSHMDIADFLQLLSTSDAENFFDPPAEIAQTQSTPYTASELAEIFRQSDIGKNITRDLKLPHKHVWGSGRDVEQHEEASHLDDTRFRRKYANSFPRSISLNLRRNLIIWVRDRRVLIANAVKNVIMGISVGGVFFQTDDVVSILGVLFQGMLFIMLGAMTNAPGFVDERVIYYKHADANFFSAYPFIIGKAMSKLPQIFMDCMAFGTILYFMVGLTKTAENFFTFMAVIFVFSVLMTEMLFIFATVSQTKSTVQVISACLVFFFILFCGFIIAPNVIPHYYSWIYWWNPMAWAYRALIVNEYRSDDYSTEDGDNILSFAGFVDEGGQPFGKEWVAYSFLYMIPHTVLCMVLSALGLIYVRPSGDSAVSDDTTGNSDANSSGSTEVRISFKPVTLSFEDICYDVKASKNNEQLRLLHNANGAFKSGRMCALMGSSGAGKTTLMDVIALRKTTGTVQGDVRLNGHPQEPIAFRRCSGYVEQFDVQSPQLTIRETVLFSARLRLDPKKVKTDEEKQNFCDQVLRTLELTSMADCLVGSDEEGGLSFEQRKRLSIAVELAASPAILFLDEPTTGLDARSALLVVKLLRKVADQGRTVCATIHQPSSAVFELFDDLLLLKKGGHVVFFGELGQQSQNLIHYFESHGASPIDLGDNPANWMLRNIQEEDSETDLAEEYSKSPEYAALKHRLEEVKLNPNPALQISYQLPFAAPAEARQKLMNKRLQTIYWRSPAYNLSRILVCVIIAFILGSVFVTNRRPKVFTEAEVRAWLSVTFLSFIIIGILSITSVLPVMLGIRDIFYRHRAAGMLDNISLGWALGMAEKWFIVLSSFFFCLVFVGVSGLTMVTLKRAIRFWGIFTFNLAIYSYFGQAFMCCVRSMPTAQILASVFIGLNNFFSGLIVRPQFMTGFFEITYWITPGHYVYEGLVLAQFSGDERPVIAVNSSEFYFYLVSEDKCDLSDTEPCEGSVAEFVHEFFGGRFNTDNELQDILVLALFLVSARVMTFFALKHFNFSSA